MATSTSKTRPAAAPTAKSTTAVPLRAADIKNTGAYEWLDIDGLLYVGFIRRDSRGRLHGAFVSEEGHSRARAVTYSDGHFCEGSFFGPMPLKLQQPG